MRRRREQGRTRGRAGFSLIEVSISLGILAFGLLTIAVMQIQALRDGSKGRHVYTAAMIAREQVEQIQRVPFSRITTKGWNDNAAWMANVGLTRGDVNVDVQEADGGTSTEQLYNIEWQISTIPGSPDLRNVELEVSWAERNQRNAKPTRTGNPTVAMSTIVVNNSK
ncbi:MAG: type IV pilus modification PilV family protein [Myxococcota bacterium]